MTMEDFLGITLSDLLQADQIIEKLKEGDRFESSPLKVYIETKSLEILESVEINRASIKIGIMTALTHGLMLGKKIGNNV